MTAEVTQLLEIRKFKNNLRNKRHFNGMTTRGQASATT